MSNVRCYMRRYKDATCTLDRVREIAALMHEYEAQYAAKMGQIALLKPIERKLLEQAGKDSWAGCRGRICDEVCQGFCYICNTPDSRLRASYEALAQTSACLFAEATAIANKVTRCQRILSVLTSAPMGVAA